MEEIKQILKKLRIENQRAILERVKYNAYNNEASNYSARKLNLYNVRVKEAVL